MLEWLYYTVTFILWCWHKVFGLVFGEANAFAWVLGIIFLTFTVRAILFKPFVSQVRSMRKMQDFAPEIKKIQKRYANDKQRQAAEMQRLQREHGVNPLGGCLPILLQVPVFIGLNHVLRAFAIHAQDERPNYFFNVAGTQQYMAADLFGSNLGQAIYNTAMGGMGAVSDTGFHAAAIPVAVPLMILGSILTHLTARHSVARQNPASATPQTEMMNRVTLWVFPIGLLAFGALLPIGLLLYFLANNLWTLMQQRVVYTRIDREEEAKKAVAVEKRSNLGPKPGQRPGQKKRPAGGATKRPATGQKQTGKATPKTTVKGTPKTNSNAAPKSGETDTQKPATTSASTDGQSAPPTENGTGVPGLLSDSTKKKSGKKRP